jgi:hypothetical protein
VRALQTDPRKWSLSILVSETDQGVAGTNLNDPALFSASWKPSQCIGLEDADTLDQVLHFLDYDAGASPPFVAATNTGLVGTDRIVALQSGGKVFVGVVSLESDEGLCSLNGDLDQLDEVVRITEAVSPVLPLTSTARIVALEDVPGGTEGLSDLGGRILAVVSESDDDRDHNGDGLKDLDLVAWLNPSAGSPSWVFDHNSTTGGIQPAATDWMGERPERDRLPVTFREKSINQSINSGGDMDTLDSAPSFALFEPADDLDFPGPPIAIDSGNAGIEIAAGVGFYRVDEAEDNRDWNGDGVKDDFVLFRTTVLTLQNSEVLGVLNALPRPALESSGSVGAAYLADEGMANVDYNGDTDTADFVLRWFRLP